MSTHYAWEDLPPIVTGYCSDDADMEAEGGKNTKRTPVHHRSRSLLQLGQSLNVYSLFLGMLVTKRDGSLL
ncbi:hypothetical protein FPQ18DRAFT_383009 [Pyronema domesticum]|nr:hypothetical protein FPQ18DRAFT_383009 [Pyronema domesticum]